MRLRMRLASCLPYGLDGRRNGSAGARHTDRIGAAVAVLHPACRTEWIGGVLCRSRSVSLLGYYGTMVRTEERSGKNIKRDIKYCITHIQYDCIRPSCPCIHPPLASMQAQAGSAGRQEAASLKFQKEFNFGSDLTFFSSLRHANLFFRKSLPPALPPYGALRPLAASRVLRLAQAGWMQ